MLGILKKFCLFLGLMAFCAIGASAGTVAVGYVSWDLIFPGNAGQFDITNETGPNSGGSFPITTSVNLASLSLTVDFVGGGSTIYGSSYFSLGSDGLSFNGTAIPIGGTNPQPLDATLTGTFSPTTINDPGLDTIQSGFSVFFSDATNGGTAGSLQDGDFGIIYATQCPTPGVVCAVGSSTPEPGTFLSLGVGLAGLLLARTKRASRGFKAVSKIFSNGGLQQ